MHPVQVRRAAQHPSHAAHRASPPARAIALAVLSLTLVSAQAQTAAPPATAATAPATTTQGHTLPTLLTQARAAMQAKDWATATGLYAQAVAMEPKNASAHNGLCWNLILASRPQEARPACEQAQALDPQRMDATINLGHTHLLQGEQAQAWRWYEQAIGLIQNEKHLNDGLLEDFNIFERQGWQVELVRQARARFEPMARSYLKAQTQAQALMEPIQAANQAKDRARELSLRQQYRALLAPWLPPGHPRWARIESAITKQLGDQLAQAGRHREAIPHYEALLRAKEAKLGTKPVNEQAGLIVPLNDLGGAYSFAGDYPHALPLLLRALAIAEKAEGPDHRETGTSMNNLALLYINMGQYTKALPLLQRALAITEKAEGPDHAYTGTSLNNLALLYQDMGQYAQALPLYQRALAIVEAAHGPDHRSTGISVNNLADLYRVISQYAQALPLYQRALAISEKANGPEHPSTGTSLSGLALLYRDMGQYAQALPLYQRALVIAERVQGPAHPETGIRLSNLAELYQTQGQYAKALPLFQRALAISEKAEGPEHPSTGIRLSNLAELYQTQGQYAQALPLYQRALAIAEKQLGPDHPDTGIRLSGLAGLYRDMGQYAQALPLTQRALAIAEKAYGPEHPRTCTSLNDLAVLYFAQGQYAQAQRLLKQSLAILEKTHTPEYPSTGTSLHNLATLHREMGQYAQALPLSQRALVIAEKAYGPEHPSTGINLTGLAQLYQSMGQYAQALPLYQRALAISEKAQGPDHPHTGTSLNNLAELYRTMGQYAQALPLYQRALAISEKANGPEHPDTGIRLNNLALLYQTQGQYAQALPLYQRALLIADRAGNPALVWGMQGNLMNLHGRKREAPEAAALHQPALAIWYGKQAINTLQSVRGQMQGLSKDLQKGFLEQNQNTYQTLANLLIEAGRIPEAEQVLVMLKERELGELVRSGAAQVQQTQADYVGVEKRASAQMAELSARGVREATELAALKKRLKMGDTLSPAELARRRELEEAAMVWQKDMDAYLAGLPKLFAEKFDAGESVQKAKLARINLGSHVALDPGGAIGLHYVVADDRVGIIVATPSGSFGRFSPVRNTELRRRVEEFRTAVMQRTDTRASAQALWKMLIEPVLPDIEAAGARTLVLSLDDALRYVPFAALQNPQGRYVLEDYAVANWATLAIREPQPSQQAWSVTAFGLTQARGLFSALPAVRDELGSIVRTGATPQGVLPGEVLMDEQFDKEAFFDALLGRNNVLHIASHFDFKPGDESLSVLLLGKAGETLSLAELSSRGFNGMEQVTLSACDTATGGGRNENGAEVEGLATRVLNQQAKAVLATLWKVADASTARLMQNFYRQRAVQPVSGSAATPAPSRAQALRAAQLAMLRGQSVAQVVADAERERAATAVNSRGEAAPAPLPTDPARPHAHPYYWAPFVLSGSWL